MNVKRFLGIIIAALSVTSLALIFSPSLFFKDTKAGLDHAAAKEIETPLIENDALFDFGDIATNAAVLPRLQSAGKNARAERVTADFEGKPIEIDKYRSYEVTTALQKSPDVLQAADTDVVFIIDASQSMRNNLESAKKDAAALLLKMFPDGYDSSLPNAAKAALVTFYGPNSARSYSLTGDRNFVISDIEKIRLSSSADTGADGFESAFSEAEVLFAASKNRERRVIIFTDGEGAFPAFNFDSATFVAYTNKDLSGLGYGVRADDPERLNKINFPQVSAGANDGFVLIDTLGKDFEFASNEISVGYEEYGSGISGFAANFETSQVKIQIPNNLDKTFYVSYKIKIKDDAVLNASPDSLNGSSVLAVEKSVLRQNNKTDYDIGQVLVSAAPDFNVSLAAREEAVLADSPVSLSYSISGSGYYAYKLFYNGAVASENSFMKSEGDFVGDITDVPGGEYKLLVKDLASGAVKEADASVTVLEPKIILNVTDIDGGYSYNGAFEIKLSATGAGDEKNYIITGLGQRELSIPDVKKGTVISASVYVPYGYEIVSVTDSDGTADGKVTVDFIKKDGGYIGYEHNISVKISKLPSTDYFFDWNWNNQKSDRRDSE